MTELDRIVEVIKRGPVKRVYAWQAPGLVDKPPVPYCVVKPAAVIANYQSYQIWAHFAIGKIADALEYLNVGLIEALMSERGPAGNAVYKLSVDGVTPATDELGIAEKDNTIQVGRMAHKPLIWT